MTLSPRELATAILLAAIVALGVARADNRRGIAALRVRAVTIWLPLAQLPLVYALGYAAACGQTLVRLPMVNRDRKPPLRARIGIMAGFHGRLYDAPRVPMPWRRALAGQRGLRSTLHMMRDYRHAVREAGRQRRARETHTAAMAGVRSRDEQGLWLDRREFHDTKEALRNLTAQQASHAMTNGDRYSSKLLGV